MRRLINTLKLTGFEDDDVLLINKPYYDSIINRIIFNYHLELPENPSNNKFTKIFGNDATISSTENFERIVGFNNPVLEGDDISEGQQEEIVLTAPFNGIFRMSQSGAISR